MVKLMLFTNDALYIYFSSDRTSERFNETEETALSNAVDVVSRFMKRTSTIVFKAIESLKIMDMAIDLGTANTVMYGKGKGVIIDEPSCIAWIKGDSNCKIGKEASAMIGRTPEKIAVSRPLKGGVIADLTKAEKMVSQFIAKAYAQQNCNSFMPLLFGPTIIVCVPSGSTSVERKAIQRAAESAGGRDVYLIEEPMAAAVGAGLPVSLSEGSMMVDIGGGTAEVAVISLSGIVYSNSIRVGGDVMNEEIVLYVRDKFGVCIGDDTAERVKKSIGSIYFDKDDDNSDYWEDRSESIRGRDLVHGIPKELHISRHHVAEALKSSIDRITSIVKSTLHNISPELSSDISSKGIFVSGGGALIRGIDVALSRATGLPVTIVNEPLYCVARGLGYVLENFEQYKSLLFKQS